MDDKGIPQIFSISTEPQFEALALKIFNFQYSKNIPYQRYCRYLGKSPSNVFHSSEIPFLPIAFFKSHKIATSMNRPQMVFESSGTTGSTPSRHYVQNLSVYQKSHTKGFVHFYGPVGNYRILALLPSYLERKGSSLVYMVDHLVGQSKNAQSRFYLHNLAELRSALVQKSGKQRKTLLIGVSFALLDLAEQFPTVLENTIVMETGGMKGRRKEPIREELHHTLKKAFGVGQIHSEYGMTELLSQAYSKGDGKFKCPPWMKIAIRDSGDPLSLETLGKTGGINVIDLANIHSCSFIATQDLGKIHGDGTFEVLGRFDHSDIRGCNLMTL